MDTKVILVTGGSTGIGAQIVRLVLERGWDAAIFSRGDGEADALHDHARKCGRCLLALKGDVGVEEDVTRVFRALDGAFGRLNGLVNAAGINGEATPVAEVRAEMIEAVLHTNVVGTILCCREAARRMSTRRGGPGGAIVNVSSFAAAFGGRPGRCHYAASKAAVDSFSIGFAREVAGEGIRVNCVRPGFTRTPMTAYAQEDPRKLAAIVATIPMGRVAEPHEAAHPVLWLLSEEASFVSGAILDVSGGGLVLGGSPSRPVATSVPAE